MAEKLSATQQTVIDRMAAGDALTRGVSSRHAYLGVGNTRRKIAFVDMNALQDRGLIERCDRIGQPFITWCLTDAGRALITTAQPTEGEMAENTYTITALEAANDDALWRQVARGEVEVTDSDGDTVLKSLKKKTERGNTVYEPFTIAMDTDGERNECPVLYHSNDTLTVHRLQPPADTPPGEPPAEAANRTVYPPTGGYTALQLAYFAYCAKAVEKVGQPILNYEDWIEMAELVVQARWLEVAEREAAADAEYVAHRDAAPDTLTHERFSELLRYADKQHADALTELRNRHVDIIDFYRKELQQIGSALGIDGVFADDYGTATMFNAVAILQAANAQLAARAERAEGESTMLKHDLEDCEGALLAILNQRGVSNFKVGDYHIYKTWNEKSASAARTKPKGAPLADGGDAKTEDGG